MRADKSPLWPKEWRVIDHTKTDRSFTALHSFAVDDALCYSVGHRLSLPVVRTWVHDRHVVLGSRDRRLPYADEAIKTLQNEGYAVVVRNSGGAAVALDTGVLNISLIVPVNDIFSGIDPGYELMAELVREILSPFATVDTGEIAGSYCPGSFDLSISGRKFGGIAQRRRQGAMAVQAFLLCEGTGIARARLIRRFYEEAVRGAYVGYRYPVVTLDSMASLSELTGRRIDIPFLQTRLLQVLQEHAERLCFTQLLADELQEFANNLSRLQARQ
ncbi:biotin/lipoate A/B protein ligase family protein [Bacillaceae bacterium]